MENRDLLASLGLVEDTLDSTVRLTAKMLENVETLTDVEKVIAEATKRAMGNDSLDSAKDSIVSVSHLANVNLSYATQFLQSLVTEYAVSSGSILSAESVVNQHVMSHNVTKTDAILNNEVTTLNNESMGFFERLWKIFKNTATAAAEKTKEFIEGDGTVIEKIAQFLGAILSEIFTLIAESFGFVSMTLASGFLHLTNEFNKYFDFDLDTILDSIVIGAPKLQAKFIAQKEDWELEEK